MPPLGAGFGRGRIDEARIGQRLSGHRRQHRALPAALAEPRATRAARIMRAASMRGIRPEPARHARELALLERGAVGGAQPHAHLEMARPPLGQGVDRLEQHLHALRRHGLGNAARAGGRARAACPARAGAGIAGRSGRLSATTTARRPSARSDAGSKLAGGRDMVRAAACKAATDWPIMTSVSLAAAGFSTRGATVGVALSSSASFLISCSTLDLRLGLRPAFSRRAPICRRPSGVRDRAPGVGSAGSCSGRKLKGSACAQVRAHPAGSSRARREPPRPSARSPHAARMARPLPGSAASSTGVSRGARIHRSACSRSPPPPSAAISERRTSRCTESRIV